MSAITQKTLDELLNFDDARLEQMKSDMAQAEGFPHFCIDDFLAPHFAAEVAASYPRYEDAAKVGRSFNAHYEKRKVQVTDSARFPAAVSTLNDILASELFKEKISYASGIENLLFDDTLNGGGMHLTQGGGRLDIHVDFNFIESKGWYRRLNLLLYLNEEWKPEWGGALELWDKDVKHRIAEFQPKFNRLCGFVTSEISFHGVTPVTSPEGKTRKSFAMYYYTKEIGEGISTEHHSTIFKPRPDEGWRDTVVRPISDATRKVKGLSTRVLRKLGL